MLTQSTPHHLHCRVDVAHDQLSIHAHDTPARASKRTVTARVPRSHASVIATVNFHREPARRCTQVDDKPAHNKLTTKANPKLAALQARPELGF